MITATQNILTKVCRISLVCRVGLPLLTGSLLVGPVALANPNIIEPMPVYTQPQVVQQQPLDLNVSTVVAQQPLTYVTAAPTGSQQLRQERANIEQQTVETFAQSLEQQRLRDEQARAAKARTMFAQTFSDPQQQVVQAAPAVSEAVPTEASRRRGRIGFGRNQVSFGLLGGFAGYPGLQNVQGRWSMGGFLSTERMESPFQIDISYHYANFGVTQDFSGFSVQDLQQHNIALGIKYKLFRDQRLRPYFGALVAYTLRRYDNISCTPGVGCVDVPDFRGFQNDRFDSHAGDYGAMVGLEVEINDELTIGADARYMKNAHFRNNFNQNFMNGYNLWMGNNRFIEQSDYYFASITAKFSF